jgi:glycerophosphoryl diester phosphodiesterase
MSSYGKYLVAHRGFSHAYPENTLLSVESALALGACFVEVDVHLSADHVPVVIHDAELQRTAGLKANVMDTPFSHLQQFSVHEPGRFASRYLPQRIPALQDVVDLIKRYPGRVLFCEAKRASIARFGIEAFLDAIAPVIATIPGQCVLISFQFDLLSVAKQRGLCPVGWVFDQWDEHSLPRIDRLQPDYVFTDYASVPAQWEVLPQGPWKWAVYAIDEPDAALQWFQKGASMVETNDFGEMIKHPSLNNKC